MSGENVLVTGGTGFIGQKLVKVLIKNQYNVAVIVRDINLAKEMFGDAVHYIDNKTSQTFKLNIQAFSPDIVAHLAAYSTSRDDLEAIESLIESNVLFLSRLLDGLRECDLKLFINTGSFSEYYQNDDVLNPAYFYSATKISSRYIIDYFSKVCGFRVINNILYTVYGGQTPHKKVIDYIISSLGSKVPINMTAGEQVLDFVHIDDVVNFYLLLINKATDFDFQYREYNVATGQGSSIKMLSKMIEKQTGQQANINWGAIEYRPRDIMWAVANIQKERDELQWQPLVPLENGVKRYLDEINIENK